MSNKARDWNDISRAFKSTRRGQLYLHQSHALRHYEGECHPGKKTPDNPPKVAELACPICGLVFPFSSFTEDHCPQKSGQSSYGGRYCVVLTCSSCNHSAGKSYEAESHQIAQGEDNEHRQDLIFEQQLESGLFIVAGTACESEALTDLKTAFLVAFAALGYRFAFAPALRPIRAAIMAGTAPAVVAGPSPRSSDFPAYSVCEVWAGSGDRFVLVVGDSIMWNLPAGLSATSGRPPLPSRFQAVAWPEIEKSGNAKAMQRFADAGQLFHGDVCYKHKHREFHGPSIGRAGWPVRAEDAGPARRLTDLERKTP